MIQALLHKKIRRHISWTMLSIMVLDMICPTVSYALSSGPVQPEIQSFEPVGTTDMVDLFTGDFVYNIPLLDVEGYPINISYHGGVTMDQEASWVGLGWNISPGAVNRGLRGLPDEFAGDTIEKEMNIKPEITKNIGLEGGVELFGAGDPYISIDASLGGYLTISNYRGVGVDFTTSAGINTSFKGIFSAGLNVGASIGSQTGAAVDYGAMAGVGISQSINHDLGASGSFNLNTGGTYSPRTGLRRNVGFNASIGLKSGSGSASLSTGTSVPIAQQNYSAAVTNASYMNSFSGQLKLGGEVYGVYINGKANGSVSTLSYDPIGSRKGYGYFNLDKATDNDLLDFAREKDGTFNTTMFFLPQTHLTYDVYNVSGQGTGGSFRPFRNDVGSVYDPVNKSDQHTESLSIEGGLGNLFSLGGEYVETDGNTESGPWSNYKRPFTGKNPNGGYFEDVYFKEAGELTQNNETYLNSYGNTDYITPENIGNVPLVKPDADTRIVRANHIFTHTGADADTPALVGTRKLVSYTDTTGFSTYPTVGKQYITRVDNDPTKKLKRTQQQITEIVQTQKDGRRYVYGLPVLNNVQREVTFAVDTNAHKADKAKFLIDYDQGSDDSRSNGHGIDHYYSSTVTPSYVTAHLLTGVLSADYVDVTGDGITDDDLGTYTKFNYSRKSTDYRWRSPMENGKAQFMPGYYSDRMDDKASYIAGSREQWMLHSIETKNYVAEFYVSKRNDALGYPGSLLHNGPTYNGTPYDNPADAKQNVSYKLDSIVLYNKHDRFTNGANAQPIKTVFFTYDYSLCKHLPNSSDTAGGKLTLKKIQIRYGTSNLSLSAAYNFTYSNLNPDYDIAGKDKWGFYKPNSNPFMNNFEFPFVDQNPGVADSYAPAWSLTQIGLPSGGVIKVDYEADDYGYVQDKEAKEMFMVAGMGSTSNYDPGANQLYFSADQPNLYFYFKRRQGSENGLLTFPENYMRDTNLMYYNIPVELKEGLFEPIKGYATVEGIGICPNNFGYGYVKLAAKDLEGSGHKANPVTYAALNVGRYSLPQVLFPGSDPESSDITNIVTGLKGSLKELFGLNKSPLLNMINDGKGQDADLHKAFMRLTSPGLKKKGGGQRVKTIRFYDSWSSMAGGNEAIYGKTYDYTMPREDGKGTISSGVASYEPMIGGDEIPQRLPVSYTAQQSTHFPPNDPVDLYQEFPVGESFYPGAVVGYRKVTARSINIDKGRSSQSEDVSTFYTAKDFPIQATPSSIHTPKNSKDVSLTSITTEQESTQGFSIVFNDMHGKQRTTEHYVLKPDTTTNARELVNYQQYDYLTQNGQLSNMVPSFDYNASQGQLQVVNKKMGIETDVTVDSRMAKSTADMHEVSGNLNGFIVVFVPIAIPIIYPFGFSNVSTFKCATVTKVTQQYGIISKVTSNNQGAITEVHNDVFDPQTGNVLVTSVNNQYGDREFTASYPAYWAYKELGPSYENHDLTGKFSHIVTIDTFGKFSEKFVNYNEGFSSHYDLSHLMPVARVIVNEEMPKFKIGDELLLQTGPLDVPVKVWVMGYSADDQNCYLIMATREPYKQGGFWTQGNTYNNLAYRVTRSGNRNRLGETLQSFTTTDSSNIYPYLKDDLTNLVSLNATRYNHNLDQVYAANVTSDSLNPFTTGKINQYRPERQVVNLKDRDYTGGTARKAGVFNSASYWPTEKDTYPSYCTVNCDNLFDSLYATYLGGDSLQIRYHMNTNSCWQNSRFRILYDLGACPIYWLWNSNSPSPVLDVYTHNDSTGSMVIHNLEFLGHHIVDDCGAPMYVSYNSGCCNAFYELDYTRAGSSYLQSYDLTLSRWHSYAYPVYDSVVVTSGPNGYYAQPTHTFDTASIPLSPFGSSQNSFPHLVSKKIQLGKVGHYDGTDDENWVNAQHITKYNWYGQELENLEDGIGYNSAIYGYNQQLPICVTKNARQGDVLYESFDDYALLRPVSNANESYKPLLYSPFEPYLQNFNSLDLFYKLCNLTATGNMFTITSEDQHTGTYSLKTGSSDIYIPLNGNAPGMTNGYSFKMNSGRKYVASVWLKPTTLSNSTVTTDYSATALASIIMDTTATGTSFWAPLGAVSPVIDGWQQFSVVFTVSPTNNYFRLKLGKNFYYDDLRIYPFESNSKGFVYHPVTRKLMATLDENNYATFYEYDAEGNLVRTKKETSKGILTVSESRSTHRKTN
ncbi:hypothetical protein ACTHGU_03660 [Chitinophagaceae bacterium MMS25-I14]